MREAAREELTTLRTELQEAFKAAGPQWADAVDHIWAFGPRRNGPNILLNRVPEYNRLSVWGVVEEGSSEQASGEIRQNDSSIMAGFQMATQAGPLCEEPLHGVCFAIERWERVTAKPSSTQATADSDSNKSVKDNCSDVSKQRSDRSNSPATDTGAESGNGGSGRVRDVFGPMSGQLMSVVKDGCRKSFQTMPQRLMVAMYHCTIQASTDALGKCPVTNVINF